MSDVAQILGGMVKPKNAGPPKPPPPLPPGHHPTRAMQMTGGIPKEVMDLVGGSQDPKSAALPPIVPTFSGAAVDPTVAKTKATTVKVGNKWINTQKPARKWVWASFASSARTDGLLLNHWVRHGIDYPDYPYAKFDIHLDPVTYASEQEYRDKLQDENWTKSETDQLLELARKYELRWPVIYDRWLEMFHYRVVEDDPKSPPRIVSRKVEDLQYRYYSVAAILAQHRIAQEAAAEAQALAGSVPDPAIENPKAVADALLRDTAAARTVAAGDPKHQPLIHNLGTGTTNKVFDLTYEKERRAHLELLWHRTKEEEEEEVALRKELRLVDTQIRKLKKSGGHIIAANDAKSGSNKTRSAPAPSAAAAAAGATGGAASSSREASRSASPANAAEVVLAPGALMDQSFASTAPTPTPGTPYLQSGRLAHPATGGAMGLNKTLLGRMDAVLADLKIGTRPIPTKRVCDTYDSVRKDILTLLTLRKMVLQKEGQLQSKRVKLSRMGGKIQVADEETALGIPKPQPLPPPVPTTPAVNSASAAAPAAAAPSTTVKPKAPRTGGKGKSATTATGGKAKAAAARAAGAAVASQGGEPSKGKASDTKAKSGATSTAAKPAATGKQAAAKQGGGKQVKKPAAKRKRKSVAAEAKSPAPASSASAATIAQAQAAAGYVPPTAAATATATATPAAARPPTAAIPAPVPASLPAAGAVQPAPVAAAVPPPATPTAAPAPAPAASTKKRARKS